MARSTAACCSRPVSGALVGRGGHAEQRRLGPGDQHGGELGQQPALAHVAEHAEDLLGARQLLVGLSSKTHPA